VSFTLLVLAGCDDPGSSRPEPASGAAAHRSTHSLGGGTGDPLVVEGDLRLEADRLVIEGVTQCGEPVRQSVRLSNRGVEDETVVRSITSCGCARLDIAPGTVVPAGGHLDVPVVLKAWGGSRRKAHEVRFILEGNRLGPLLSLDVEIVSPLRTIPSALQQALHPDGLVRLVSADETDFRVIGVEPPIPFRVQAGSSGVEIGFDWSEVADWSRSPEALDHPAVERTADGAWDHISLRVVTDHPDCDRLNVDLYGPRHEAPVWLR